MLESYPVPKSLHQQYSRKISPVFRDVTELTAHHSLSDKIKEAVLQSEYLIILCSPASKNSHWVNQEIRLFRESHGEKAILCALIEGTPETSFPPALLETGAEPLAADLTPKNFRLGVSQLAASILGVGLDELVRRDLKKMRQRVIAVTASAALALLVMGGLTSAAMDARQEAEQRRADAEGQIEFMITDLKDELESVGRLDALQAVGERASTYYDNYAITDHDDDALGRRARVYHYLGEIQDKLGNLPDADRYFQDAFDATEKLLMREPNNASRVFEHAQSAFWVGYRQYNRENYEKAKPYFQFYLDMANRLKTIEGNSERAQQELAYAYTNMGALELDLNNSEEALIQLNKANSFKAMLFENSPDDLSKALSSARGYGHLGDVYLEENDLPQAIISYEAAQNIFHSPKQKSFESDTRYIFEKLKTNRILARLYVYDNNIALAKVTLNDGKQLLTKLVGIDDSNVNLMFETIQIQLLDYEIAYIEEASKKADAISRNIFKSISNLPKEIKDGYFYDVVVSIKASVFLYEAAASTDPRKRDHLVKQARSILRGEALEKPGELLKRRTFVTPIILFNALDNSSLFESAISEICNAAQTSMTFHRKLVLANVTHLSGCQAMDLEASLKANAVSQAMSNIQQNKFDVNEGEGQ